MKTIFKKLKKGFTIVELVIVIAVIAILAAVLIPTLANLVESANESNDMVLVSNLNKIVAAYDTVGEIETVNDALDGALENGYSVSNLTPTSEGNVIVYDSVSNRFALLSSDFSEVIYKDTSTSKSSASDWSTSTTWKFVTTDNSDVTLTDNVYTLTGSNSYILVGDEWNNTSVSAQYGVEQYSGSGVKLSSLAITNTDTGNDIQKDPTKADLSSDTKTAIAKKSATGLSGGVIDSNGTVTSLIVNVKADNLSCDVLSYTVHNYSEISVATSVKNCSFNEYGSAKIYDTTKIGSGKITNCNAGISSEDITIYYPADKTVKEVFADNTSKVVYEDIYSVQAKSVAIKAETDGATGAVTIEITITDSSDKQTTATASVGTSGTVTLELGTEKYPYLIDDLSTIETKVSASSLDTVYFQLTADISITADIEVSVGKNVVLDGGSAYTISSSKATVTIGSDSDLSIIFRNLETDTTEFDLNSFLQIEFNTCTLTNSRIYATFNSENENGYTVKFQDCSFVTNDYSYNDSDGLVRLDDKLSDGNKISLSVSDCNFDVAASCVFYLNYFSYFSTSLSEITAKLQYLTGNANQDKLLALGSKTTITNFIKAYQITYINCELTTVDSVFTYIKLGKNDLTNTVVSYKTFYNIDSTEDLDEIDSTIEKYNGDIQS